MSRNVAFLPKSVAELSAKARERIAVRAAYVNVAHSGSIQQRCLKLGMPHLELRFEKA
jgi:hypothetical protein